MPMHFKDAIETWIKQSLQLIFAFIIYYTHTYVIHTLYIIRQYVRDIILYACIYMFVFKFILDVNIYRVGTKRTIYHFVINCLPLKFGYTESIGKPLCFNAFSLGYK